MHRQDSGIAVCFEVEAGVERGRGGTHQVDSQLWFRDTKEVAAELR